MAKTKPLINLKKPTPSQRRVVIAQDVIAGLRKKRMKATEGLYVRTNVKFSDVKQSEDQQTVDVQQVFAEKVKSCEVCVQGACFVAAVERFNKLTINIGGSDQDVMSGFDQGGILLNNYLDIYFSRPQLKLIELAFEGTSDPKKPTVWENRRGSLALDQVTETDFLAHWYAIRYKDPAKRMIAIMKNIIRNKGMFVCKPEELTK